MIKNRAFANNKGFTLVELLIVVIIIAILAAVLIPQFSGSTDDARDAALDSTLTNMRTAIDLYRQQHGHLPGSVTSTGACGTGTNVVAALNTEAAFMAHLTRFTTAAGVACTGTDGTLFGPYLKKETLPQSPSAVATVTDPDGVEMSTAGLLPLTGNAAAVKGWKYDVVTGQFIANDPALDDR